VPLVVTDPTALTRWDSLIYYSNWLSQIQFAMDDIATTQNMLAMRLRERNFLKDLRRYLIAAETDIPTTRVEKGKQREITLCKQCGTLPSIGMSYPLLAVLNILEILKHLHMTCDALSSEAISSQTGN